jgi:hypothetical protein
MGAIAEIGAWPALDLIGQINDILTANLITL